MQFGMLDAQRIIWDWTSVYSNFELWRIFSPYLFFGTFSFPFLIAMYVLVSQRCAL